MPKNQTTASKKARAVQRTNGGKHTVHLADQTQQTITLTVDGPLREALANLAVGTDGTLEETARKAILDAALQTRVDDDDFRRNMAKYAT